jgi:uncharacterized membrane protein
MRKTAEILSLAALAALAFITINVFDGPHPLPGRIPTHFDALGHVNGWGSPHTLLFFPIFAAALYLFLTVIARFPALFNYPVKITESNRAQLEQITLNLISWIKAEMLAFFAWMEFAMVQAIRNPEQSFKPYPMWVFVGILFATIIGHMGTIFRAARIAH